MLAGFLQSVHERSCSRLHQFGIGGIVCIGFIAVGEHTAKLLNLFADFAGEVFRQAVFLF